MLPSGLPTGGAGFTVAAFIKGTDTRKGIIGWGNYGSGGQVSAFRTGNSANTLLHYSWGGGVDYSVSAPGATDGTWRHVAATYDGTTKRIYLDGVEMGTGKAVGTLNVGAANFRIGSSNGGEFFNGLIDDMRVYDGALSQAEIAAMATLAHSRAGQSEIPSVDRKKNVTIDEMTIRKYSAPYRGWHYHPDHVIPAKPDIKGFEKVHMVDVPTVYQLPGDEKWHMTFIGYDGKGYQSFVAESDDLATWTNRRLAMGFGPEGGFDHGGVVLGAFLYEDYDIKARRTLKNKDGKYWSLYGAYPRQGGYELRPGYEGVACSDDGLTWRRARDEPILSVHQEDCGTWEKSCIYQPWLVEHEGRYFNFYNAAGGHIEQMGLALSGDLLEWKRYKHNPVIPNGPKGSYNQKFSSDGKVFRDGDHWVCFFFGVGRGGAHIMVAFSRDLHHWTVDPEPLYKAGGNPSGLDKQYTHKISLVWNPANETTYMFYNAVGNKGRGIGLITSRPL